MSIFDVLRYPLSNPPTADEIDNLPEDLKFYLRSKLGIFNLSANNYLVSVYIGIMLRQPKNQNKTVLLLDEVRRKIKELP